MEEVTAAAVHLNAGLEIISVKAVLRITAQVDIGNMKNIVLMVAIHPPEDAKVVPAVVAVVLQNAPLEIVNVPVRLLIIVLAVLGSMTNIAQTVVIHQPEDVKAAPVAVVARQNAHLENTNVKEILLTNALAGTGNIMNIVPMVANLQQANVKVLHLPNAIMVNINVKVLFHTIVLWEIGL